MSNSLFIYILQQEQFKLNLIFILETYEGAHYVLKQAIIQATIKRLEELLSNNVSILN